MNTIFDAIYSHFQAGPLVEQLTDLYNTLAPEKAVFPYAVFSMVSDVPDWTFTENFENVLVQFALYSKKLSEVTSIYELLKGIAAEGTGFDFQELAISDYQTVYMFRENAILTRVENVWQYVVTYRLYVQWVGEVVRFVIDKYLYNLLSIY